MNLIINYHPNETGLKIAENMKNNFFNISTQELEICGTVYWAMAIKDETSKATKVINSIKSIRNSQKEETMGDILKINGIASDFSSIDTTIRRYEVLICDLSIISIRLTIISKPKEQVKYIRESENSKIAEMAKKAIYLSGLDLGVVTVILTSKRRLKIRKIEPSPLVRDKDLASIMKMILDLYNIEETIKSREVTLGADPEFMLFNAKNGKMIAASEFFPKDGIVGCDNIRIRNRQQHPIAEIRPKPDDCPLKLIENMKEALNSASRLAPYKNVKWVAGSQPVNGYSIGGHIHFSKIKISGALLRALDNYLGIPIFLIEEPSTAVKRRKKYGFIGDYRVKEHGGFEYRTPGSWLVSQKLSTAILCLAKIVSSRYPYLPKNFLDDLEAQEAFYGGNQAYFIKHFYLIWENIKNLDQYNKYAEELKIIPEMIINKSNWDEKSDFRKYWKIGTPNKIYTKKSVTTQPITSNVAVVPRTTGRTSAPTRTTRISVRQAGSNTRTIRRASSASTNQRANISRGRIIGSNQTRRN